METAALTCEMATDCLQTVTHIDENGFIYCAAHGRDRRSWKRCRKLRPHELNKLRRGEQLTRY